MTDTELLQQILTELKTTNQRLTALEIGQEKTNDRLTNLETISIELRAHDRSVISILGELQGDIEEIQEDTQYLAFKKSVAKNPEILKKLLPPDWKE